MLFYYCILCLFCFIYHFTCVPTFTSIFKLNEIKMIFWPTSSLDHNRVAVYTDSDFIIISMEEWIFKFKENLFLFFFLSFPPFNIFPPLFLFCFLVYFALFRYYCYLFHAFKEFTPSLLTFTKFACEWTRIVVILKVSMLFLIQGIIVKQLFLLTNIDLDNDNFSFFFFTFVYSLPLFIIFNALYTLFSPSLYSRRGV